MRSRRSFIGRYAVNAPDDDSEAAAGASLSCSSQAVFP